MYKYQQNAIRVFANHCVYTSDTSCFEGQYTIDGVNMTTDGIIGIIFEESIPNIRTAEKNFGFDLRKFISKLEDKQLDYHDFPAPTSFQVDQNSKLVGKEDKRFLFQLPRQDSIELYVNPYLLKKVLKMVGKNSVMHVPNDLYSPVIFKGEEVTALLMQVRVTK